VEPAPQSVTVAEVLVLPDRDIAPYTGYIQAFNTVDLKSRVTGYLISEAFKDGGEVKKGTTLFEIDPRPYEAALKREKATTAAQLARRKKTEADHQRNVILKAKGGVSQEDVDASEAARDEAVAAVLAAQASEQVAKLNLDYCTIKADFDGRMSRPYIDVGNLVTADMTVLSTMSDSSKVYVNFDVDERSLLAYREEARKQGNDGKPIKEKNIPVYVRLEGEQDYKHEGKLDFADIRLNRATGTYPVRGILDNKKNIFTDGNRASILVETGEKITRIMVTDRAIGSEQDKRYVYVVENDPDGKTATVKRKDVELGEQRGGLRIIKEGLQKGDRVIVNGIQRVRPEMKVVPQNADMPDKPEEGARLGP
jgi:RND family efflux transporter MFP subunit